MNRLLLGFCRRVMSPLQRVPDGTLEHLEPWSPEHRAADSGLRPEGVAPRRTVLRLRSTRSVLLSPGPPAGPSTGRVQRRKKRGTGSGSSVVRSLPRWTPDGPRAPGHLGSYASDLRPQTSDLRPGPSRTPSGSGPGESAVDPPPAWVRPRRSARTDGTPSAVPADTPGPTNHVQSTGRLPASRRGAPDQR